MLESEQNKTVEIENENNGAESSFDFDGIIRSVKQDMIKGGNPAARMEESSQSKPESGTAEAEKKAESKEDVQEKPEKTQEPETNENAELSSEVEELKKKLDGHQRFSSSAGRAIKMVKRQIEDLLAEGRLEETEAETMISALSAEGLTGAEAEALQHREPSHLDKLASFITQDVIQNYLEYSEDGDFVKKMQAFDMMYKELDQESQVKLVDELLNMSSPLKAIRKIVQTGEEELKSDLGEVLEFGSVKKYADAQKTKIQKMEKNIEQLKKKLSQYEDFDKPTEPVSKKMAGIDSSTKQMQGNDYRAIANRRIDNLYKAVSGQTA